MHPNPTTAVERVEEVKEELDDAREALERAQSRFRQAERRYQDVRGTTANDQDPADAERAARTAEHLPAATQGNR